MLSALTCGGCCRVKVKISIDQDHNLQHVAAKAAVGNITSFVDADGMHRIEQTLPFDLSNFRPCHGATAACTVHIQLSDHGHVAAWIIVRRPGRSGL